MSLYAIGDIQGCLKEFKALLRKINFDQKKDHLWLVGDMATRGPHSLETLRYIIGLQSSVTAVLGNHDISLLAAYHEVKEPDASLKKLLKAQDCPEIIKWLTKQKILVYNKKINSLLVHAGLLPQWDLELSESLAKKIEGHLRGKNISAFLDLIFNKNTKATKWSKNMPEDEQLRVAMNAFTRIRYCDKDGIMDLSEKRSPGTQNSNLYPWFDIPNRKTKKIRIVCGHWASLGYQNKNNVCSIDTGCIWGEKLTAVKLGSIKIQPISVKCNQ
ncbi:MAG: symmetrical bis(5'-nucleosyl)-tetraphosphatase [Pseudomonadota bacterium]